MSTVTFSRLPLIRRALTLVSYLIVLFAVSGVLDGSTYAQQRHKQLPTEEMERYDDPPAGFWGTGTSPGMESVFGPFVSHQVNVNLQGMNIIGDAANEPSIAVQPTDHNKMAIGWRQFDSVTSNFRQSGYGFTTDAGNTWTFPRVLEDNVFRSDPVLVAQDDGKLFYNSSATRSVQ